MDEPQLAPNKVSVPQWLSARIEAMSLRGKAEDEDKEQDKDEEAPPKLMPLTQSTERGPLARCR